MSRHTKVKAKQGTNTQLAIASVALIFAGSFALAVLPVQKEYSNLSGFVDCSAGSSCDKSPSPDLAFLGRPEEVVQFSSVRDEGKVNISVHLVNIGIDQNKELDDGGLVLLTVLNEKQEMTSLYRSVRFRPLERGQSFDVVFSLNTDELVNAQFVKVELVAGDGEEMSHEQNRENNALIVEIPTFVKSEI